MTLFAPLSYSWLYRHYLRDSRTVLDLGCGRGAFVSIINHDHKFQITGIELFDPYIKIAKTSGYFEKIIKKDITKYSSEINSYDAVISSQVHEHLLKKDATALMKRMKQWAKMTLIIGVPNGKFHQGTYDGNKLQEHRSVWEAEDFRKLGFTVYGQGFGWVYGQKGILFKKNITNSFLKILLYALSYAVSPLMYFRPEYATYLVAVWHKQ